MFGDTRKEKNESLYVVLFSPTSASIAASQATGTIVNVDLRIRLNLGKHARKHRNSLFLKEEQLAAIHCNELF